MTFICHYESMTGRITLVSNGEALTGLWFDRQKHFGSTLKRKPVPKELPVFIRTMEWLDIYFSGNAPAFTPPLCFKSPPLLRKATWEILLLIPFGQTMTYEEIAIKVREKTGIRGADIGYAVATNPISLIIPSHRAVKTTGSLSGYPDGIGRKIQLLKLEKADMKNLYIPRGLFYELRDPDTKTDQQQ